MNQNAVLAFLVFYPLISAFLVWLIGKNKKSADLYVIVTAVIEFLVMLYAVLTLKINTAYDIPGICGLGIGFVYTGFRGIFGLVTAFAWTVTFLFSREYRKADKKSIRYDFFNLITLGAAMGIFLAGDLFTVFLFFELMSLTSFMWVIHRETKEAFYAAGTYLGIAIAGGLAMLMGIFLVYHELGTIQTDKMYLAAAGVADKKMLYAAAGCMFVGFGAKAGAFPVHAWLPQTYTQAPAPAAALLSAVLSKTGIFGLLLISNDILYQSPDWGMFILINGLITMTLGAVCGVFHTSLKTTLAYSSMSQIGFILVGIGMQGLFPVANAAAGGGTLLHMVNHSIIKLVLFMVAGAIFLKTGSYDLNQIRGYGRRKPFLHICFLTAATGVGGIPLLNGYVSKTLLHESIVEYRELIAEGLIEASNALAANAGFFQFVEFLFLFCGGLTLVYMIKLYVAIFLEKNEDATLQKQYEETRNYLSIGSKAAIGMTAVCIPVIGSIPHITADKLIAYGETFMNIEGIWEKIAYFSLINLYGGLISVMIGAIVYFVVVRGLMLRKKEGRSSYRSLWPRWMDMEKYIYRKLCYQAIPFILAVFSRILDSLLDAVVILLRKTVYFDRKLPHELPEGNLITHDIGSAMEVIHKIYCACAHKEYKEKHYEHKLAMRNEDFVENFRIIERSLSFGLFMFCVGLSLTLLYLLCVN